MTIKITKEEDCPGRLRVSRVSGWWIAESTLTGLIGDGPTKQTAYLCLLEAMELQIEATVESGNLQNLVAQEAAA